MKFLKLKFVSARLIKEKKKNNMLGTNRFFHPINKMHIYNSVCVLIGRTPKSQLRKTDSDYMPIFEDVLKAVNDGYAKIKLVAQDENITTIKKAFNSNCMGAVQYTWKDCQYIIGNLLSNLKSKISKILNIDNVDDYTFEDIISKIQKIGIISGNGSIVYNNESVKDLNDWLQFNSATGISNYIENIKIPSRPTAFGKKVHRGVVTGNNYSGEFLIPFNDDLFSELLANSKGFSKILDGGLVTIVGYGFMLEDEFKDFVEISKLNDVRKFYIETNGVKWENTIYDDLDENNLMESVHKIIENCGVIIDKDSKYYINVTEKLGKIKLDKDKIGEVAYTLNKFIETTLDNQYK